MASASHKANILNPSYAEIGVGVARGTYRGSPATMVVQLFAEPAAAAEAAVAVAPEEARPAPAGSTPQDVYGFAGPPASSRVLGAVSDLDADVRTFYLVAILLLLAVTGLTVGAKYRHHQIPHVLHAMLIASIGIGLMS
jgi:hypothetical protein